MGIELVRPHGSMLMAWNYLPYVGDLYPVILSDLMKVFTQLKNDGDRSRPEYVNGFRNSSAPQLQLSFVIFS